MVVFNRMGHMQLVAYLARGTSFSKPHQDDTGPRTFKPTVPQSSRTHKRQWSIAIILTREPNQNNTQQASQVSQSVKWSASHFSGHCKAVQVAIFTLLPLHMLTENSPSANLTLRPGVQSCSTEYSKQLFNCSFIANKTCLLFLFFESVHLLS